MSSEQPDPIDGSTRIAYRSGHRALAAQIIDILRERRTRSIDIVMVAIGIIDLMAMTAGNYSEAVDNALAALAQIPGAVGGPGENHPPGALATAVVAECEKIYAQRTAESPRTS